MRTNNHQNGHFFGVFAPLHPHHGQPEQANCRSPVGSSLPDGAVGRQRAGRELQLPPVQAPVEVTQVIQTAGREHRLRARHRRPPQPIALRPHSTVVGERERGLRKT